MKTILFTLLAVFTLFESVLAGNYPQSATYYGTNPNSNDSSSEKNPSCGNGLPSNRYFAAVSTGYDKKYCDDYVIALTADPDAFTSSSKATMIMAKVVDSCGGCASDQIDLSYDIWIKFAKNASEGVHKVYWVIMDSAGNTKFGPVGASLSSLSSKYGLSVTEIQTAFIERAKSMVTSSTFTYASWPWNGASIKTTTTKKTTITTTTTTTTEKKTTTTTTTTTTENKPTTTTTTTITTENKPTTTTTTTTTENKPTTTTTENKATTTTTTTSVSSVTVATSATASAAATTTTTEKKDEVTPTTTVNKETASATSVIPTPTVSVLPDSDATVNAGNSTMVEESDEYLKTDDVSYGKYYKCGEGYGSCKKGFCCSRFGWCGKSKAYCDVKRGCQDGFGKCRTYNRSKYRCGKGLGICASGCCSQYGWCGYTSEYCGVGCQKGFGTCSKDE